MLPLLYFENAMGRVLEHPNGYALIRYRPGKRTLADVQDLLTHLSRLLQRRGWFKILSDQRLLSPLSEEEQALILDFWQARQFMFGATVGAVLPANNQIARAAFSHLREQANSSLRYHFFDSELAADAWLRQLER